MTEYQITYKDTQRTSGDENNQTRGISIMDGHRESSSIVGNIIVIGASINMAPPLLSPARPLAERTAFWQTYADFFYVGMTVRITGTTADGDYVITSIALFTPTDLVADDPGSITLEIDGPHGTPQLGVSDVLFEDITEPTVIELVGSGSPDVLQTIDNNEDKTTTIKAKQLTIQFRSTSTVDINTFLPGPDNRWYVESWINDRDNIDFKGFLITDDLQQPFLPKPQTVTLLATDGLGRLRDQALVDDDGITPQGKWKISQFLSWILKRTGLSLDIFVVNSIRHGAGTFTVDAAFSASGNSIALNQSYLKYFYRGQSLTLSGTASNNGVKTVVDFAIFTGILIVVIAETVVDESTVSTTFQDDTSTGHLYDTIYLDAKTFEGSEVGICEPCRSALDKILRDSCFIEQSKGSWWIHRWGEMQGTAVSVAHFDPDGAYVDTQTKTYTKNIGRNDTIKWADATQLLRGRRPYSFIKEIYRYDSPIEAVCNFDFSRGDEIGDLPDVTKDNQTYNAKNYQIECWTNTHSPFTPGQTSPAPSFAAYIKRLFQNGYEKERYIVLPTTPSGTDFLESQPIDLTQKDKFSFSIDFAWNADAASGSVNIASMIFVTLKGDDDTNWYLDVNDPDVSENKWLSAGSGATWSPLNGVGTSWNASDVNETEFRTLSASAAPVPVSGKLRFAVISIGSVSGSLDDKDMYYNNFNFTYIPFINGSYQKYTGQYHQVSQTGEYKAKRENQVYISDSPRNIFKGAMFHLNGAQFVLSGIFYDSYAHPSPTVDDLKPYGEIQAQDIWTQFSREMRLFSGTVRGLDSDVQDSDDLPDQPDVIHNYLLTDANPSTDNKVFLMLSYEQDRKSQLSQSTLIEVYDSVIGKLPGTHLFKYLSE